DAGVRRNKFLRCRTFRRASCGREPRRARVRRTHSRRLYSEGIYSVERIIPENATGRKFSRRLWGRGVRVPTLQRSRPFPAPQNTDGEARQRHRLADFARVFQQTPEPFQLEAAKQGG